MAETTYQKKLRADLEALNLGGYLETDITIKGLKDNYDGSMLSAEDIQDIADGNPAGVFRRDPAWTELPSGAGFYWRS